MQTFKSEIKGFLDSKKQYQECLFKRGYLITENKIDKLEEYPFYNNWNEEKIGKWNLYIHNDQHIYIVSDGDITASLIGHAYNPFTKQCDENEILKESIEEYKKSPDLFFEKISELTGIHVICIFDEKNDSVIMVQDCCGMQSCFYGKVNEQVYITDYPQLVADICNLNMDTFVEKLISSKCYHIGNRHLPGNLSPYKELKRLGDHP